MKSSGKILMTQTFVCHIKDVVQPMYCNMQKNKNKQKIQEINQSINQAVVFVTRKG